MNKVIVRSISGIIYIAIIVGCIFLGVKAVTILSLVLGLIGLIEFKKITSLGGRRDLLTTIVDYIGIAILILGVYDYGTLILWPILLIIRYIISLYDVQSENPVAIVGHSVLSQVYLGIPLGFLPCLESFNGGGGIGQGTALLAVFIMIWVNDTGAFCVGSLTGKHRLFERISPKKSWEGFWGGMIFNIVAGVCFCLFCPQLFKVHENIWTWIGLGIIVTIFATFGDLFESLIKRTYKVKDSGHWIPGHGGILDRIDSLLFVAPISYAYLQMI